MKARLFLVFIISLLSNTAPAQMKSCVVEYQHTINSSGITSMFSTLYGNGDISVFHEKMDTRKVDNSSLPEGTSRIISKSIYDPYMKIDRKNKEILFYEPIGHNKFLVTDNFPDLKWDLTQETKDIAGYKCIKAITYYRGRQWNAWFAPDIPLPFGPWKLHGLPGLILEAADHTNSYIYKAVKIEFRKDAIFDRDFKTLVDARNTTPITYQQFLNDQEEYSDNVRKKLSQETNATITKQKFPPSGYELKYEWEQ